jgi:predicted small lipoprotein YifL
MMLWRYRGELGLILFFLVGLALAGCGQKGALYLPEESAVVQKVR